MASSGCERLFKFPDNLSLKPEYLYEIVQLD